MARISNKVRGGFTLFETMAVVVIVVSLASFIAPVFNQSKRAAKGDSCLSNLRQVGMATEVYMADYSDHYPTAINAFERQARRIRLGRPSDVDPKLLPSMSEVLLPYVKDVRCLRCPLDEGAQWPDLKAYPTFAAYNDGTSYIFAELFQSQSVGTWDNPANRVFACDGYVGWHTPQFRETPSGPTYSPTNGTNRLFYDWHVHYAHGNAVDWGQ